MSASFGGIGVWSLHRWHLFFLAAGVAGLCALGCLRRVREAGESRASALLAPAFRRINATVLHSMIRAACRLGLYEARREETLL